jgi:hypothetical protein
MMGTLMWFVGLPCALWLVWHVATGVIRYVRRVNRRVGLRAPDPKCVVGNWRAGNRSSEAR